MCLAVFKRLLRKPPGLGENVRLSSQLGSNPTLFFCRIGLAAYGCRSNLVAVIVQRSVPSFLPARLLFVCSPDAKVNFLALWPWLPECHPHSFGTTDMLSKVKARLRDSRHLAPSGCGGVLTQPRFRLLSHICTSLTSL